MAVGEPGRIGGPHEETDPIGEIDATGEIDAIEREIDALAEAAERCRKTIQVARAAVAIGAALLAVALWRGDATSLVTGIAACLGGLAVAGSTRTTREGVLARIATAAERRAALIDALALSDLTPAARWAESSRTR